MLRLRHYILIVFLLLAIIRCSEESEQSLVRTYFSAYDEVMLVGETQQLVMMLYPANSTRNLPDADIIWTSSDTTVITVDQDGNITALSVGKSTITVTWGNFVVEAVVEVDGSTEAIEDELFLNYCLERFDENGDGILQNLEVAYLVGLDLTDICSDDTCVSLAGIELFVNLQSLTFSRIDVTYLDLSKNTKLTDLNCSLTTITSLDLSNNTQLVTLDCHGCENLTELTLGSLDEEGTYMALNTLNCYRCAIETLDLSRCADLEYLDCRENQLSDLDASGCPRLIQLSCSSNNISTITLAADYDWDQMKTLDYDEGVTIVYASSDTE